MIRPRCFILKKYVEMARSFYITLPSNGSMGIFPDNTVTEYKNQLPRPLHLDGEWEVGMTECSYPYSWFQLTDENSEIWIEEHTAHPGDWQRLTLNPLKKLDRTSIGNRTYLPRDLKDTIVFNGTSINDKLILKSNPDLRVKFKGKIAQSFGWNESRVLSSNGWETADYPWTSQNITQMFVYTDIITPHPVGDQEVPLLKTFSVSDLPQFGSSVDVAPPLVAYYPVNRNPLDSIQISIRDGTGKKVGFTSGRSIVTLHFRQRRSSLL